MNTRITSLAVCLLALTSSTWATIIIGSTTGTVAGISTAGLAAGLASAVALKVLAIGAIGIGAALGAAARRGKRSIGNVDFYFNVVEATDTLGCGLRLVCELETYPEEELAADERLILSLFGTPEPLTITKLRSPKAAYDYAAFMGFSTKDHTTCSRLFNKCPYSAKQLMAALREADPNEQ